MQTVRTPEEWAEHKERTRRVSQDVSISGRDIAPLPAVVNPRRKKACERDFRRYCKTYHRQTFTMPWGADHLKVIGQIETAVLGGGLFATAMPRGSGKTSLVETAAVWAILYGHRSFVVLIGSDEGNAVQMLESIKTELGGNDLLLEDFPEAIHPIMKLEGISMRCKGQIYQKKQTHIGWSGDEIVIATIPGSKASGAIIKVAGLTGGIRGLKHKRGDGETSRPDLVLVDDPQTDLSARSPSQCQSRERILAGAILGLAGPRRKIAGLMPCTVIQQGDLADKILDRDLHPEWNGTRTKMVYAFPSNEALWAEYARIRAESLRTEHGGREATAFYRRNRKAMDAGAVVAWPARHDPDELSAVQHAMNLRLRDERAFFAEYQNEPMVDADARPDDLTPDQVAARLNHLGRGEVPTAVEHLTCFVDISGTMLWWMVCGWEDDFTGYVLDYGAYPDQKVPYYTLGRAKYRLADVVKATGLEGQIFGGLQAVGELLLGRAWERDDGASMKVQRALIDSNWSDSTATVVRFCRQSAWSSVLVPYKGKYVGAAMLPMNEWQKRQGEKAGLNWKLGMAQEKKDGRRVVADVNFWKSFVHNRLSTAMGDRGSLTLFGDRPEDHRMLADQLCSEYRVRTVGRGRECDEWKSRPNDPDNHFLDCLAGNAVAASMLGAALRDASGAAERPRKKRFTFADMRARQAGHGQPQTPSR